MNQTYEKYYRKVKSIYEQPVISASVEVILSVFTIALLILVAIRPTIGTILTLRKSIEDLTELSNKLNSKITSLSQAQQTLEKNSSNVALYRLAVPSDPDLTGLAKRIEILAQEHELKLDSVNYQNIPIVGNLLDIDSGKGVLVSPDKPQTVTVNINLVGRFSNISQFVNDLERLDRLVLIESANYQKSKLDPENETFGSVKASIKTSIYYKLMPQQ